MDTTNQIRIGNKESEQFITINDYPLDSTHSTQQTHRLGDLGGGRRLTRGYLLIEAFLIYEVLT